MEVVRLSALLAFAVHRRGLESGRARNDAYTLPRKIEADG